MREQLFFRQGLSPNDFQGSKITLGTIIKEEWQLPPLPLCIQTHLGLPLFWGVCVYVFHLIASHPETPLAGWLAGTFLPSCWEEGHRVPWILFLNFPGLQIKRTRWIDRHAMYVSSSCIPLMCLHRQHGHMHSVMSDWG